MFSTYALIALSAFLAQLSTTRSQELPQTVVDLWHVDHISWDALNISVHGRLSAAVPFAQPCFGDISDFESPACKTVQEDYLDELARADRPTAYINTQWETCQITRQQCLLNFTNPADPTPALSTTCELGSIPQYFIDVRSARDVQVALAFSKHTSVPLVIKNTGHDYKGRSSAPDSLALWTHNLKQISLDREFVAEGCDLSTDQHMGVTVGAGVQWQQLYGFAEANNITIVGGTDRSVGVAGGWPQGGGHSLLTNTMGLGVDRILQYKLVTPDGRYRVANKCQHRDLFWALRGGGGGTFGVVLESTIMASPQITVQTVTVSFPAKKYPDLAKKMWSVMVSNGIAWAEDGWGGISVAGIAIYINPILSSKDAAKSIASLIEFGRTLLDDGVVGASVHVQEFPSWGQFFEYFAAANVASVGTNLAFASRLINRANFATVDNQTALVNALWKTDEMTPGLIILASTPYSYTGPTHETSVTPLWRESIYHTTIVSKWNWNATRQDKQYHYDLASLSMDNLRRITPDAAYVNEADVYERNYQESFWGRENYERLLKIKHEYDPDALLDCWMCVGWHQTSRRYECYL
ncbi:FAD-binding domain-containing protein [Fistulina hepatica ATCC 64428]|uniref:FAD-binding domain-containing protein n=1 Tax=Fistulina hepatica ATCC 64428 TaxID=1128425 RepID=A0A0D7A2G2_9AGAR|nr:FAD-binding domain-containing protein [Fistulina hepatica ATCC 64428]